MLGSHAGSAKAADRRARAAPARSLIVVVVLGDGPEDDRVHTEHAPKLCGGEWIGAVAIAEVLFRQPLVERGPLNDAD